MAVRKTDDSRWVVDLRPNGVGGRRIRKLFDTKAEANRYEKLVLSKVSGGQEWNGGRRKDSRHLSDLIELWWQIKGIYLKDGPKRRRYLGYICDSLNDPVAVEMRPASFADYRASRLEGGTSEKTLNNELGYLKAVFNQLVKVGEIEYPNPIAGVDAIRIDEQELAWLTHDQIRHLLDVLDGSDNPHVKLLTEICLSTGARWGEAESLKLRHVRDGKVSFHGTKSGKSRSVPISDGLFSRLHSHLSEHKEFTFSRSAFSRALDRSEIELPKGQAAHVLRHTFASHFVMNGGNILTLQKILGHSSLTMTMRYAHLSPDHLLDAVTLNPLSKVAEG
ncbi:phage integrase [Bacterioplanoides sp.]|uniref:phage integrase n=1 Tax=Bacterioplanoides sp. TaxID=2066072 RepID=UPI003B5C0140